MIRRASKISTAAILSVAQAPCANKLTTLDLLGCMRIDDDAVAALHTCHSLQRLSLQGCKGISSGGLERLLQQDPPPLAEIELDQCMHIDDAAVHAICNALGGTLHKLSLAACLGVTDAGIAAVCQTPKLLSLNVSGCKELSASGLLAVAAAGTSFYRVLAFVLTSRCVAGGLQELSIERLPKVKADQVIEIVQRLPGLRKLRKGMLNDRALIKICEAAPQLQELGLGALRPNGTITDIGLEALAKCRQLRSLDLCGLHVCSRICEIACMLPLMQHLDIRGCHETNIAAFEIALQPGSESLLRLKDLMLTSSGNGATPIGTRSGVNVVDASSDCCHVPFKN